MKGSFRAAGLEVRRARESPRPLALCDDPLEAVDRRRSHDHVALNCPLARCVVYNGLSLAEHAWHPLVQVATRFLNSGSDDYEGSILQSYYAVWRPAHAREALIGAEGGPAVLDSFPAFTYPLPWSEATLRQRAAFMARVIEIENRAFREDDSLAGDMGYYLHGPASNEKGRLELARLIDVVRSIERSGYRRDREEVTVQILQRGDEFRYLVVHGHHRVAAARALGLDRIPVIPVALIDRRYATHWPGVYREEWRTGEALAYFDHLFDFDSRAWANRLGLID
ncbi:MAG: ParB/RepB/Spo0J family partition protein [Acidobacteriota bacterium]|nr:ParB/RepB/Spo0J family partition protein [Acidobacteriota bacterium]